MVLVSRAVFGTVCGNVDHKGGGREVETTFIQSRLVFTGGVFALGWGWSGGCGLCHTALISL